jgi:hypothetical protein
VQPERPADAGGDRLRAGEVAMAGAEGARLARVGAHATVRRGAARGGRRRRPERAREGDGCEGDSHALFGLLVVFRTRKAPSLAPDAMMASATAPAPAEGATRPRAVVLVTGASGLVGRALRDVVEAEAKQRSEASTAAKNDTKNDDDDALFDARWVWLSSADGDLCDAAATAAIFERHRPSHVIHLAAHVGGLFANMARTRARIAAPGFCFRLRFLHFYVRACVWQRAAATCVCARGAFLTPRPLVRGAGGQLGLLPAQLQHVRPERRASTPAALSAA